ncbi:MAG: lipid A-modifier LpxR family protein, partial [Verrucomicrobiota bacterium]
QQRVIGRNIFLDGSTFADGPSVDKRTYVADFRVGVGASAGAFMVNFAMNWRTNEFYGQSGGQWFGSLNLGLVF